MKQLQDNLNSNKYVNAIKSTKEDFYDFDTMLGKYYNPPQSRTVNRLHIFLINSEYLGKLISKDSVSAEERVQHLKRGDLTNE